MNDSIVPQHAVDHARNGAELARGVNLGLDFAADAIGELGGEHLLPLMLHVVDGGIGELHHRLGGRRQRRGRGQKSGGGRDQQARGEASVHSSSPKACVGTRLTLRR